MKMLRHAMLGIATLAACAALATAPAHAQSAPIVNAGPDQTVNTDIAFLAGAAQDADTPANNLTYLWTLVSGPDDVVFENLDRPNTMVTFTTGKVGVYVFQLLVSDGTSSATDTVEIVYGPLTFQIPGFQATFFFDTVNNRKSKFKFVLIGQNAGDLNLDLRGGDRLNFVFGGTDPAIDGVTVGRTDLTVPAGGDWIALDFKTRAFATNARGETFDGLKSAFKTVKARYRTKLTGQLSVTASNGALMNLLGTDLPDPGPVGSVSYEILPVAVVVVRRQNSQELNLIYFQYLTFEVKKTKRGITYKSQ